jgi:hypothetical protein
VSATVIDLEAIAQRAADLAVAKEREQHKRDLAEVLAQLAETPRPLEAIMGIKRAAANARIARDAGLRALGVPSGRRLLFKRGDVESYLRLRGPRVRTVRR